MRTDLVFQRLVCAIDGGYGENESSVKVQKEFFALQVFFQRRRRLLEEAK